VGRLRDRPRRLRALSALVVAVLTAVPALAVAAPVTAVFAVDLGDAASPSTTLANAVRERMAAEGEVLTREETAARLAALGVGVGFALDSLQRRLDAAEAAQQALEVDRSIEILEGLLQDLENDADFTRDKQALHELARLRVATRLLALAGPDEDGSAKTERGARARAHMLAAARVNPTLTLSEQEHSPRMRRLLAGAHDELKRAGLGGLHVDSTPAGATVIMEGRPVGLTPLRLLEQIPRGVYRVWLERDGARSVTRRIEIGERPAQLEVDLGFEGALWRDGPGLLTRGGDVLLADAVVQAGRLVRADRVVLTGVQGERAFAAVVDVVTGVVSQRVATHLVGTEPSAANVSALLASLAGDPEADAPPVPEALLPGAGVHAASAANSEVEDGDEGGALLWIAVGGASAGLVVVGLLTAGALAWALAPPPAGRFGVEVVP